MFLDRSPFVSYTYSKWNARRNVEFDDLFFAQIVQLHDNGAKAVAVSSDDDVLACFDLRNYFRFEVRQACVRPYL